MGLPKKERKEFVPSKADIQQAQQFAEELNVADDKTQKALEIALKLVRKGTDFPAEGRTALVKSLEAAGFEAREFDYLDPEKRKEPQSKEEYSQAIVEGVLHNLKYAQLGVVVNQYKREHQDRYPASAIIEMKSGEHTKLPSQSPKVAEVKEQSPITSLSTALRDSDHGEGVGGMVRALQKISNVRHGGRG